MGLESVGSETRTVYGIDGELENVYWLDKVETANNLSSYPESARPSAKQDRGRDL